MILDASLPASIDAAAQALARGELLGLPTETVYGLAANADDAQAVARIFAAKGRPADHPLIVHLADSTQVPHYAREVPLFAQQLMDAFWPGPLTLILPRLPARAAAAAAGQASVGLRCPAHPAAQAVLAACAQLSAPVHGLAAPSANRFGRVSPTTAAHVAAEFGPDLLVLDGGACPVGIESTIVDCTRGVPVLLRPGAVSRADIERACGLRPLSKDELQAGTPRASGTLLAHYAPAARVRLMDARQLQAGLELLGADAAHLAVYARTPLASAARRVLLRAMPQDAAGAARELFAALRDFDDAGVRLIWIETPPDTPDWEGVRDRLARAAAAADA
ncbi:translation factor SUA5 [Oryzisolibacter propanilivorax]|uniref:Threonylcarbamoyl-AMP synthase n=1 Tax=Oryzisolibacter propanilivorax TaxID=1527607 RepID=A0A1G9Q799_9BURK|nr:L-threonylcarbamoyladenylate synthase [Oryzisolibacter propanilivorax]SDM06245.1 translation factor SUA5 [Oryzisolibacter propanilivorax]